MGGGLVGGLDLPSKRKGAAVLGRPRLAERHPEGSLDVLERWAWALLLKRRHLLSQREVFQYEVGAAATHRPDGTGTERDPTN
jgi:hypothetical protein